MEFKWNESNNFCRSQWWCLGVIRGRRGERRKWWDWGNPWGHQVAERGSKDGEYSLHFSNAFVCWDFRNSFKIFWTTDKGDLTGLRVVKKMSGMWPLYNLLFSSDRKLVSVLWILFHLPTALKPLVVSDSTWLWFSEIFSNDRAGHWKRI